MPGDFKMLNRRSFIRTGLFASVYFLSSGYKNTDIKKVALIGDSIRSGYQPVVMDYMRDKIITWGPEDDTLNTVSILQHLKSWLTGNKYDIIHINSGLNDLRTVDYYQNEPMIPAEVYSRNVELIIKLINKYSSGSIVIWATTTPVIDDLFNDYNKSLQDFRMKNEDVITYNNAAMAVANRLGVAVNDMYAYLMEGDPKSLIQFDGFHFSDYGNEILGERVTDVINKILNN